MSEWTSPAPVGRCGLLASRDVRVILPAMAGLIVCLVSLPAGSFWRLLCFAVLISALLAAAVVPVRWLARRLLVAGGMTTLLVLSALWTDTAPGRWMHLAMILGKALLSISALSLLTATYGVPRLLRGLEQLCLPSLLTQLMSFTHRYALLLVAEARRLKRAADSRGARNRWLWQAGTMGRLLGTLFVRAFERGERVHMAMLARGFGQRSSLQTEPRPRPLDWVLGAGLLATAIALRFSA